MYDDDNVDTLSNRVLKKEHEIFVETLQKISKCEIRL